MQWTWLGQIPKFAQGPQTLQRWKGPIELIPPNAQCQRLTGTFQADFFGQTDSLLRSRHRLVRLRQVLEESAPRYRPFEYITPGTLVCQVESCGQEDPARLKPVKG